MKKIVKYKIDGRERYGILNNNTINPVEGNIFGKHKILNKRVKTGDVTLLPPVNPSKIVGVGLNYRDHADELNMPLPDEPIIFIKPSTGVIGHKQNIIYPEMSRRVDYEAELAIIIKKRCKNVTYKNAGKVILGITCFNDVTARDLQSIDGQWSRSKSFDTFSPMGPCLLEFDDNIDLNNMYIKLFLNGKIKQDSNTQNMIFKPFNLISFITSVMTLLPGDIIATGTPAGIGEMRIGDKVEVEIENIGKLTNFVVKE